MSDLGDIYAILLTIGYVKTKLLVVFISNSNTYFNKCLKDSIVILGYKCSVVLWIFVLERSKGKGDFTNIVNNFFGKWFIEFTFLACNHLHAKWNLL